MRSLWIIALFNPLNLLMLVSAIISGLLSAWWMLPAGLVLWLIMVLGIALDPALRINQAIRKRQALTPRFQTAFTQIERSQIRLFNMFAAANYRTRSAMRPIQDAFNELVEEVYQLCQRMTPLENYRIITDNSSTLQSDLNWLDRQIAQTEDPRAKDEYQHAKQALQTRFDKQKKVSTSLERLDAQLTGLNNTLQGFLAEVVRIQSMGVKKAGVDVDNLVQTIRLEVNQIKHFDQENPAND